MSEAMFNKQSWSRAMGPTLRTIGYFSAGFLLFVLLYYLLYFLASFAAATAIVTTVFGFFGPVVLVFYFLLCIFKVLDEEMSGI